MPPITRWFIKTAIVYLLAGIILAFVSELPTLNAGPLLLPVYWHMIVIGWITQVIMGVSIWMFPRKKRHRKKTQSFSAVAAFGTLNTGLILRFLSEPFLPLFTDSFSIRVVIIISSLLQVAGILFYIAEMWPRVQPKKKRKRKKKAADA